jgi:DNA-binding MarR family transcriptional regulator
MTTYQKIIAALERLGQALRSVLLSDAMNEGLSITQAQILVQCYLQPGRLYGVSDLATELDLSQPTVSDAVAALHRKGLVQKLQREDDRRAVAIVLTPAGKGLARRLWHQQVRRFEQALAHLSPEEANQLLYLLLRTIALAYQESILHSARTCLTCRFFQVSSTAAEPRYFCTLLEAELTLPDLRILCPEHELPQEKAP